MGIHDKNALKLLMRSDFKSFARRCFVTVNPSTRYLDNWHVDAIAYRLMRVMRGECTRLIINVPPRYMKSLLATVAFPAFLLGHDPAQRIFSICYGEDLADKHASDFTSIVKSSWYKDAFAKMRIARSVGGDVLTTAHGFRKTTTVMGPLTGLGGDLFIIDDPLKAFAAHSASQRDNLNSWVTHTLMSRLDNKETGAIIVVMQRIHDDDLSGFLMRMSEAWERLSLPAIAEVDERIQIEENAYHCRRAGEVLHPARESLARLETHRATVGSEVFSSQYQQSPIPPGGNMIKRVWVPRYDALPQRTYATPVVQSWDTASKEGGENDFSACTTWLVHEGKYYLIDVVRKRLNYPDLKALAIAHARAHKVTKILIEDTGIGTALITELQKSGLQAVGVKVQGNKRDRMSVQSAKFESGHVLFPRAAAGLEALEAELFAFPGGRHDDQVDSISQALANAVGGYDTSGSWW